MTLRLMLFSLICVVTVVVVGTTEVSASVDISESPLTLSSVDYDTVLTLAQDDSDNSGGTRIRGRSVGKLIGLAVAVVIGIGSFIMKMFRGEK
jgi:hypothetical protein